MISQNWIRVQWKPKQIKEKKPWQLNEYSPIPSYQYTTQKYNVMWVIHFTGLYSCCRWCYKQLSYQTWCCRKRLYTHLYFFVCRWSLKLQCRDKGWMEEWCYGTTVQNVSGNTAIVSCLSISIHECLFCHSNEHVQLKVADKNMKKTTNKDFHWHLFFTKFTKYKNHGLV